MLCIEQFRKTVLLKCKVANSSPRVRFAQGLKCTRLCLFNIESPYPRSPPRTGKTVEGLDLGRSEERRVGKECRSRCAPYHVKENGRESASGDWFAGLGQGDVEGKGIPDVR